MSRVGRGLRRARREARIVATQDRGVRRTKYTESWKIVWNVGSGVKAESDLKLPCCWRPLFEPQNFYCLQIEFLEEILLTTTKYLVSSFCMMSKARTMAQVQMNLKQHLPIFVNISVFMLLMQRKVVSNMQLAIPARGTSAHVQLPELWSIFYSWVKGRLELIHAFLLKR